MYGETGKTYELELKAKHIKLPFVCNINFTALGGDLGGDLIQVSVYIHIRIFNFNFLITRALFFLFALQINFIKFNIGRFMLQSDHACVDGWMIIEEQGLPNTSGKWCGQASGYSMYYSETYSINLLLNIVRLYQQTIGNNFEFYIKYKFLTEKEASLRYE